ncbi:hypothetical protein PISMIDRAFT_371194 [Pisolithus microcarpus 441]|uniref:MYND-type domain-containing protein n=1 Tax=Pisolithus microcarpus 441 TaxID=765257 RepID=A0A0C9YAH7_9AGAM|nr:hypothetical protein PISMIDRAFT_371194 [Pisolithus microcarpus 441]
MSHPLFWPSRIFFYPLGNTSAVSFTGDLPPECKADVLFLGCGDPRNILYTVYTDVSTSNEPRKLDITCCDIDAAILARNTLLFTLLADDAAEDRLSNIWNIFYHMMLDESSLSLLIEQCRKLAPLAESLDSWRQGPYAHIVTMCSSDTLSEIGRFWKLWLATSDFNPTQTKQFRQGFTDGMKNMRKRVEDNIVATSMRSAGPLAPVMLSAISEQFRRFWMTGITDDGSPDTKPTNNPNPTFAFSLFGDKFAVHYGTDPITGFHLAEALASSGVELPNNSVSVIPKIVRAARQQFRTWCKAVICRVRNSSASSASLIVRMYAGEALAFCQALRSVNTSVTQTPIFIAPWRGSVAQLDVALYSPSAPLPAPTSFNVIETSNLIDHVGLLNLLTVTIPLLFDSPSSTLYTEALLPAVVSPPQGILNQVCGDLSTISLLLGVVPSAYVSRFTTRSNTAETMMQVIEQSPTSQYHERLAWKHVNFGHPPNILREAELSFTVPQLAKQLLDIYLRMFSDEDLGKRMAISSLDSSQAQRAVEFSGLIHYSRRSLALLLAHIRSRVCCDWNRVMDELEALISQDRTFMLGSNYYQELACQLHLAGFRLSRFSPAQLRELRSKEDPPIFRAWNTVPEVVTVVLVVPHHAIAKVQSDLSAAATPTLECRIHANIKLNSFVCLSASFGKLEVSGKGENKVAVVVEDEAGINGMSPMIVSFSALSTIIIRTSGGTVGLAVRPNIGAEALVQKLGLEMYLFKALLTDERYCHILTRAPTTRNDTICSENPLVPVKLDAKRQGHLIHVEMDGSNGQIRSLTAHVDIVDPVGQASLASGRAVTVEQLSPNKAKLHVDRYEHVISFPLPIDTANAKLRIARKSKYVEVVAPMTLTLNVKGESDISGNFRTAFDCGVPTLWNMHRVNLDRCPPFKLSKSPKAFDWLGLHIGLMFSQRERMSRARRASPESTTPDTLMNLKSSLYTLLVAATGLGGPIQTEFFLCNAEEKCYATILVTDIRLDLGSHTIVADSWIIPWSNDIQNKLKISRILPIKTGAHESEAWRHLLPLFIERCRTWKHKPSCEYLVHNSVPLYPGAGSDPKKVPWCSCGMGIGTEMLRERYGSVAAQYATRAAISPLFAVSYMEKVGVKIDDPAEPTSTRCVACGKGGVPLSACSRCKRAKYCSKDCQVKDWKTHKKNCVLT